MRLLLLGRGKTGALVAEVARKRGHEVRVVGASENAHAQALTREALKQIDVAVDFTTPAAALENIAACTRLGASMVVGTTGWYGEIERVRRAVEAGGIGFLYGPNFSIGVNIFFEIVGAASGASAQGYAVRIMERHHAQKKDAPSGTAGTLKKVLQAGKAGPEIEITSLREGDAVGQHVIMLDSEYDTMMLVHDAKSRLGFAEGAVRGAEWLQGKSGFFEFRDVFKQLG